MVRQLSLPGIEPRGVDHVYFAVLPDRNAAGRINGLAFDMRGRYRLHGVPVPPDRLHISLHWVGDACSERALAMAEAAANAVAGAPPFEICFDRVVSFKGGPKRPLVLVGGDGVEQLLAFRRALGESMLRVGLYRYRQSAHTPHVTMLYGRGQVVELSVEPVAWTVREFVLIHSLVGRGRHVHLARWPLRGVAEGSAVRQRY